MLATSKNLAIRHVVMIVFLVVVGWADWWPTGGRRGSLLTTRLGAVGLTKADSLSGLARFLQTRPV